LKLRGSLIASSVAWAFLVSSGPAGGMPPKAPSHPAPRLFALATLPRVRLEAAKDHVVVVHDVNLPRGEWSGGDIDLFVAFGAPGAPRAMDARLSAGGEGGKDPLPDAASEPIAIERAPRRPSAAYLLLGPPTMAGAVLHVREAAFRRAVGPNGVARIRVRALHELPAEDAENGRETVVRLGTRGGEPLALARLEVVSPEPGHWITRAEAHLCGPDADPYPLALVMVPKNTHAPEWPGPAAPVLATRHPTDDLCVRLWTL
jgi:hypothetical protein